MESDFSPRTGWRSENILFRLIIKPEIRLLLDPKPLNCPYKAAELAKTQKNTAPKITSTENTIIAALRRCHVCRALVDGASESLWTRDFPLKFSTS